MSESTLAEVVSQLEAAYTATRRRLADYLEREGIGLAPEAMTDESGRYILLDALVALAQAKAALDASRRPAEGVVARPGDTLVLRFGRDVSIDQFSRFREMAHANLSEQMPGVKLVFVGGGVEQMAVCRSGEGVQT
ncbi:hypothetical protein [Nonomuraea sp. NPDC050202]|uniref:hypothetical protein n=1 Tax=Nonomuraea sp. NPDC050202 TaxID=3155035 RepID=UPI0033CEDF70